MKDNLYYDKAEVSNLDWLEYLFWLRRVFAGDTTYKSALPDTNIWYKEYPCLRMLMERRIYKKDTTYDYVYFSEYYFRHPAYRNCPVVGITQEQAKKYSKWRSDRVFEYLLIKYGKLKMNTDQDKDSYFTIEKYICGNYKGYMPDSTFKYYPEYRLPSVQEWEHAVNFSDSTNKYYYTKHPRQKCLDCKLPWADFQSDIDPCIKDTFIFYRTTIPVLSFAGPIYNLRGNVSEWTSEDGVTVGGGWADSKERILANDTFHLKTKNAWTGFRNICEWKKWEK